MKIRFLKTADWPTTWRIIESVLRAGETYSFATDITESDAFVIWVEKPAATFVALWGKTAVLAGGRDGQVRAPPAPQFGSIKIKASP